MDSITLENFRCFGARQTARLAPLTLLVGENSTGKTSFLALIRALGDVTGGHTVPDFDEPGIYPLGSFKDIVHEHGARGEKTRFFEADVSNNSVTHSVRFEELKFIPYPVMRRISTKEVWVEFRGSPKENPFIKIGIQGNERTYAVEGLEWYDEFRLPSIPLMLRDVPRSPRSEKDSGPLVRLIAGDEPDASDYEVIAGLGMQINRFPPMNAPVSGGPILSPPLRTYTPRLGAVAALYLADLYWSDKDAWLALKSGIEKIGANAGLFDEIRIKPLDKESGSPFQIYVRKFGKNAKGPWRNIVDVGYGVSQAIPQMVALLREKSPRSFLLQQPETHLHPSAQAAMASLFCSVSGQRNEELPQHQLIVETHSDYIIDRVRMDVRDKKRNLKPEDVSILFFERTGLDVKIHSLHIDEQGNVLGAPPGYRQFFIEELDKSIGF